MRNRLERASWAQQRGSGRQGEEEGVGGRDREREGRREKESRMRGKERWKG